MIDHFPKQIDELPASVILDSNASYNHVFFTFKLDNLSDQKLSSILTEFEDISAGIYNANDSTLFVINKFTSEFNVYEQNKFPDNYLYQDTINSKLPVPNFWFPEPMDSKTLTKLDSTFKLYVLEANNNKNWPEKYYTKTNQMPKLWEHGYSKGVALSKIKRKAIYWFAIW